MNTQNMILSLFAGTLMSASVSAMQTGDRSDSPRNQGQTERHSPEYRPTDEKEKSRSERAMKVDWTPETSLRKFPSETFFPADTFNERTLQSLERARIRTVGDLLVADLKQLSGILELDPRRIQAAQKKIRASLK